MNINEFLLCSTPSAWLDYASRHVDILLLDHAHCEKKAAQTAINLILRYPSYGAMVYRLSRFAREELRHFEQVYKIMQQRGVQLEHLSASRYAKGLIAHASKQEPQRMIDSLIIGAFIEARSCERFQALIPYLDDALAKFYSGLLASEQRHFAAYLQLAEQASEISIETRIALFAEIESELITSKDQEFRFHSGIPAL